MSLVEEFNTPHVRSQFSIGGQYLFVMENHQFIRIIGNTNNGKLYHGL